MPALKILNTREVKKIKELLKKQFNFSSPLDYVFLLNSQKKLFILSRDLLSQINLAKLSILKSGLYFGELKKGELRLSMEGAWLIGKKAKKNVFVFNKEEVKKYFQGEGLSKDLGEERRYLLLKFGEDVFSCARYKEGRIINFLPKAHRTSDLIV